MNKENKFTDYEIKQEFLNTDFRKIKFQVTCSMLKDILLKETKYHEDYLNACPWSVLCNLMWYHLDKPENAQFIE